MSLKTYTGLKSIYFANQSDTKGSSSSTDIFFYFFLGIFYSNGSSLNRDLPQPSPIRSGLAVVRELKDLFGFEVHLFGLDLANQSDTKGSSGSTVIYFYFFWASSTGNQWVELKQSPASTFSY